jgi:hypothetical protein
MWTSFPNNLGAVIDEQGIMFHQNLSVTEAEIYPRWAVVVGLCEGKMKLFLEGKNSFVCVES